MDEMDSLALRFLLAEGFEGVLGLLLSTGDGDGESEPPFFSFFFVGIVGVWKPEVDLFFSSFELFELFFKDSEPFLKVSMISWSH